MNKLWKIAMDALTSHIELVIKFERYLAINNNNKNDTAS